MGKVSSAVQEQNSEPQTGGSRSSSSRMAVNCAAPSRYAVGEWVSPTVMHLRHHVGEDVDGLDGLRWVSVKAASIKWERLPGGASHLAMLSPQATCYTTVWSLAARCDLRALHSLGGGEGEALVPSWSARSSLSYASRERASSPDLKDRLCSGGPVLAAAEATKDTGGRLGMLRWVAGRLGKLAGLYSPG